jgi:quercetin dioxygenase-like cupin family protein
MGPMSRILLSVGAILVVLSGPVTAQTREATDGRVYKQLLDNERVRVFQADFKPGDKLGARNYPSHLMYMLTDGTLVFTPAGRTGYEVTFKAGETMWFPPLTRATENDSDKEVRVLVVEFKDGAAPRAVAAKAKSTAKSKQKAKTKAPAKPKARPTKS